MPALSQKEHGDSSSFELREDNSVIQCDALAEYEVVFHLAGQKTLHQYSKKMTQQVSSSEFPSVSMRNKNICYEMGAF
jgi:hypothetical protein